MSQQIINAVALGSVYTLFALGLTLCWGVLNLLNLGHGALFAAGAVLGYRLSVGVPGLPLWALLPVVAAGIASISAAAQVLIFDQIRARGQSEEDIQLRQLIAGVSLAALVAAVGDSLTNHQVFSMSDDVFSVRLLTLGGLEATNIQVLMTLTAVALAIVVIAYVSRTRGGRAMRSIAVDRRAAQLSAVPVRWLEVRAVALSGALAGVAGVLYTLYQGAGQAHMGDALLLKAFAVIIVAGVGSLSGTVVVAYLFALVETVLSYFAGAEVRDATAFVLIVLVLLVRPQGLIRRATGARS